MTEERIVTVNEIKFNEYGDIISIGKEKRRYISDYKGEPIYQIGDKIVYKKIWFSFYKFDKREARHIVRHYYNSVGVLSSPEYLLFLDYIDNGENPLADESLMENVVNKANKLEYELSHSQIPEYISYDTYSSYQKERISKDELLWLHNHLIGV